LSTIFLTSFLRGNFRQKKGHQLLNFGEIGVDGLESVPVDKATETFIFIYRIFPEKST